MTTDTATKIISKYESLVVLCTYNILFTNDICCGQIIECIHAMKRTPHYKQAFKRYLNDADRARREYERTVNGIIGSDRSEFFAECNDKYVEEVNKHVDMLYWQFKQALDDNIPFRRTCKVRTGKDVVRLCLYTVRRTDRRTQEEGFKVQRIHAGLP